jgi:hypothetical protein
MDRQVVIDYGDRFEVWERSGTGQPRSILRVRRSPGPVTPEDIDAFKTDRRALPLPTGLAGVIETSFSSSIDGAQYPTTMPAYRWILGDSEGCLWLEEYSPPDTARPRWWVLDQQGRLLGLVGFPPGFTPTDLRSDAALGLWRSPGRAERVRVYRLTRH